jgi:hypothetical protein
MSLFGPTNFRTQCTLPLSFRTYTQYFLVPHLASQLIAKDKNTDGEGGWEIMLRRAEVGDTLQSLTDQEGLLEDIFTANVNRRKGRCILDVAPELAERDQDHINEEVLVSAPFLSLSKAIDMILARPNRHPPFRDVSLAKVPLYQIPWSGNLYLSQNFQFRQ